MPGRLRGRWCVSARPKVGTGDAPPKLDSRALLADYEQLRADALTGGGRGWRWAQVLLARSGLAAWIATWSEHAAAANMKGPAPTPRCQPVTAVADTKPLVSVLTLMLLACIGADSAQGAAR